MDNQRVQTALYDIYSEALRSVMAGDLSLLRSTST